MKIITVQNFKKNMKTSNIIPAIMLILLVITFILMALALVTQDQIYGKIMTYTLGACISIEFYTLIKNNL